MRAPRRRFSMYPAAHSIAAKTCIVLAIVAGLSASAQPIAARETDPYLACMGVSGWDLIGPSEFRVLAGSSGLAHYFSESIIRDLLLARVLATAAGLVQPVHVTTNRRQYGDDGRSWPTAKEYFDGVSTQLEVLPLRFRGSEFRDLAHLPWASCVSRRSDIQMLSVCRSGDVIGVAEASYDPALGEVAELALMRSSGTSYNVETESRATMSSVRPNYDVEEITTQAAATLDIIDLVESESHIDDGTGKVLRCRLMEATIRAVGHD